MTVGNLPVGIGNGGSALLKQLTDFEITQLLNIDDSPFSVAQWILLSIIDQNLRTIDDVAFKSLLLQDGTLNIKALNSNITLLNETLEDANGGRESHIICRGTQSGGEQTMLGKFGFSHDGGSDDERGKFEIFVNDGFDGESPNVGFVLDRNGSVTLGGGASAPIGSLHIADTNVSLYLQRANLTSYSRYIYLRSGNTNNWRLGSPANNNDLSMFSYGGPGEIEKIIYATGLRYFKKTINIETDTDPATIIGNLWSKGGKLRYQKDAITEIELSEKSIVKSVATIADNDTFDLPAKSVWLEIWIDVITAEAATTIRIGTTNGGQEIVTDSIIPQTQGMQKLTVLPAGNKFLSADTLYIGSDGGGAWTTLDADIFYKFRVLDDLR